MFFDENVNLFHVSASNSTEAITLAANELYKKKIVKANFLEHVLEREKQYPTGLDTGNIGVAIPHTDSVYVNRSQIAFLSLSRPVKFQDMVNQKKEINVSLIFMIAMKHKHEQVQQLSNLITLFQRGDVLDKLINVNSSTEFSKILQEGNIH